MIISGVCILPRLAHMVRASSNILASKHPRSSEAQALNSGYNLPFWSGWGVSIGGPAPACLSAPAFLHPFTRSANDRVSTVATRLIHPLLHSARDHLFPTRKHIFPRPAQPLPKALQGLPVLLRVNATPHRGLQGPPWPWLLPHSCPPGSQPHPLTSSHTGLLAVPPSRPLMSLTLAFTPGVFFPLPLRHLLRGHTRIPATSLLFPAGPSSTAPL